MAAEGKVRWEDYPAFKWCRDLGEGWYLPSINEVLRIGHLYNNSRIKFDRKAREQFNERLKEHGGVKMDRLMYYFSSTEGDNAWTAMTTHMGIEPPFVEQTSKNISQVLRRAAGPVNRQRPENFQGVAAFGSLSLRQVVDRSDGRNRRKRSYLQRGHFIASKIRFVPTVVAARDKRK